MYPSILKRFSPRRVLTMLLLLFVTITVSAAVNAASDADTQTTVSWLADNWELIALIISEICAFLPSKISGILQGIVVVLGKVVSFLSKLYKKT